jgi:glutamyl-Q tRNA(Asp) synthetase
MLQDAMPRPVLRFAPSPNGLLHLGHAFSALFTWQAAADLGGEAHLRIEDIDLSRCKPEYDAALREDLRWLGLHWPKPVLRQSERLSLYVAAASQLGTLLYPCDCTRAEVARRATGIDPDGGPRYDGKCRRYGLMGEPGRPVQWRLDMATALLGAAPLHIRELGISGTRLRLGEPATRAADPASWGDAVLVRKDTPASYHLSVVVDDAAEGVTHVTRGTDLLPATDLHVLLQHLLGLPSPIYAHHGLIIDDDREKLSKSRGSESLGDLRAAGQSPAAIRETLGFSEFEVD